MSGQSIYERIKANITDDGLLPRDFSIEKPKAPNELSFVPGMMDGAGVFHHYDPGNPEKEATKVVRLIKKHLQTGEKSYIDEIEAILTDVRTISAVDLILQSIRKNHKGITPQKILEFGINLAETSGNAELVKLGISILGLFDLEKHESIKSVVTSLALYDEFTLFSVVAALNWSNGNDTVFWIAKQVGGWGKIQAVERLEPENDEIREWILRYGCSNSIMDAYLGLTCAVKGDLITALRQEQIDDELFDSISIIIDALLDEGPVEGISEYEHAEEALTLYLRHAKIHAASIKHLWYILNIRTWHDDDEACYKDIILAECAEIISRPIWKEKILKAIEQRDEIFYAANAASRMEIDISAQLLPLIRQDPVEYCHYAKEFFTNPIIAADLIELYESVLPLNDMAEGMGDYFFSDKLRKEHGCLEHILPALKDYPLQGVILVTTGLNSRVVRARNLACGVLSGWVKKLGKPLADISPKLFSELTRIVDIEVNEQTKGTMQKLIDGGFEDE